MKKLLLLLILSSVGLVGCDALMDSWAKGHAQQQRREQQQREPNDPNARNLSPHPDAQGRFRCWGCNGTGVLPGGGGCYHCNGRGWRQK